MIEGTNMYMPVAPAAYGYGNGGNGMFGGDMRMQMQQLMQQAPNDIVRQKMAEAMNAM